MADLSAPIPFDDIPLEDARRMGRGPRMEPLLYETLRTTIQALSTDAMRIHLGPEIRPHPRDGPESARRPALLALHG
jgi:hypothetical protein